LAARLSESLGGVTILQKGSTDIISNDHATEEVDEPGGLKRVGGQGDILSGLVAAFLAWAKGYEDGGLDR
jgi:ATP-dependent NAD(P)H-hydrate dehydratase